MTKSIIITGGGRGIGKATAEAFLEAGWKVGLVGRNAEALEAVAATHENALAMPCDVSDEASVVDAFGQAAVQWGHLDVLFNNAGVSLASSTVDEIDVAAWRNLIDINITGSFICAKVAFGLMRAQDPQDRKSVV